MLDDEGPDRPTSATNEDVEAPRVKRARTILACLACRQKKRRCDGQRPRCQRCVRTNGDCEYSAEFYSMPPTEATTAATRPIDSEHRSLGQEPQPFLPVASEGAGLLPDVRVEGFEPFRQLEMPKFAPPTSGPRVEDTAGVRSTFMFNPNEWSRPLVPRMSLSRSSGDFCKAYLGNPDAGNPNMASHTDRFGNSARQPHPMTEGLPDQTGLDEWTQLFLTQVFTPDSRQPQRIPPQLTSTQPPFLNLPTDNAILQLQHNSNQSPDHVCNPNVDAISPRLSNGSSKRGGKYRIPYFRYFGRTAIAPGMRRVTCEVSAPPSPTRCALSFEPTATHQDYFDETGEVPSSATLQELLPIFEQHFGYFFCFISIPALKEKLRKEEASPILLNAICAVSARYSQNYGHEVFDSDDAQPTSIAGTPNRSSRLVAYSGDVFAQKAKSQALKVLAVSDLDVCAALLLLSWNEFGCDRDAGLWMYSGMAQRMSVDCGLDRPPEILDSEEDWTRLKLFYCLHVMDSILVVGTGRRGGFQDMLPPLPAFPKISGTTLHDPFPFLVRIMALARKIVHAISKSIESAQSDELATLQQELVDVGSSMPKELQFSIQNLQPYVLVGKSAGFIFMHLWFHTLVILLHAPSIVSDSQSVIQEDGRDIALSSAKTISDIATFAELVEPKAITQPFVNYPFFTAGRLFVKETLLYAQMSQDDSTGRSRPALALLESSARQNYERMQTFLKNLETYWAGVRYITAALTQKADGVGSARLDIAQEGPNVTLVSALNSKAKAARPLVPSDPNWFGFGLTGAFDSPADQAVTILRPQNHAGPMTTHSGLGLDVAAVRDVTIPYGRNPYEWENIANWIGP